jgi:hypothetical protein
MYFRRLFRQLAVVTAIIFATVPTQASDAPRIPVDTNDACHLLTPAQISAAFGIEVGTGAEVWQGEKKSCAWREINKKVGLPYVEIELVTEQDYGRIKKLSAVSPTPESNIGDEAFFFRTVVNGFSLVVKAGGKYFSVYANPYNRAPQVGADDEKCKSIERALAREIIGQT